MGSDYLFAYGTLVTGTAERAVEHLLRSRARPVARAFAYGELFDLGGYPGMVTVRRGNRKVFGMLYRLSCPARALAVLDAYEGHRERAHGASEFWRRCLTVYTLPRGQPVSSWVYLYNRSLRYRPRIRTGDYRR
jgi:gamma-glutamylcyclotransferase (GGCT)/AIG2-like uncharacterized protein YtfP